VSYLKKSARVPIFLATTVSVELALDAKCREFGEQVGVPNCVKCSIIYVERNRFNPTCDIEGRHPLLGEQKQHVQGRVM